MPAKPLPFPAPADHARHWMLDPQIVFLNHGSFGACPRPVLEEQVRIREEMEREPVRFFHERLPKWLETARHAAAGFLHCRGEDLVFVSNATTGVATVLANLEPELKSGDELLATSAEYPACLNNLRRTAARTGAQAVVAPLPFPIARPEEIVEAVLRRVTPRTRVALISHVTSPTALVLPVGRLVRELEDRGIMVIVDGAHAPGMVEVDVQSLGASFYAANCHKWLCAPKGAALLHVREDRQRDGFRPLVLSNMAEKPGDRKHMLTEFDYTGTQDLSAWLALPAALRLMESLLPGGWPALREHNRGLTLRARDAICGPLDITPCAPDDMTASMCTLVLPCHDRARMQRLRGRPTRYHDALQDELLQRHRIQVPIWSADDHPERAVRISAQLYNTLHQYEYLAEALQRELERERSL